MSKNIYLTPDEVAEKARKKAIRAKIRAQAAEAAATQARAQLNKGADTDMMVRIAKSVVGGTPTGFMKRDFFLEPQKRADQIREPGETREAVFSRYATTDPEGRLLLTAYKVAGGEDYSGEPDDVED